MITNPIVIAVGGVLTEAAACIVAFGVMNNTQAGEVVGLGNAIVLLGALIYAAAHSHAAATVKAAQIRAGNPPAK